MVTIQGSWWPGSWMKLTFVRTRRAISSTFVRKGRARGQVLDRPCISTVDPQMQVALQPQPVVPAERMAVGDQGRRAMVTVSNQPHARATEQPPSHGIEQAFLQAEADGAPSLPAAMPAARRVRPTAEPA